MNKQTYAVTLLELLIALALLSVIILGFASLDFFSRFHVLTSDRRAKIQNEISHVLEDMSKQISRAIGDINNPAITITSGNNPRITAYIDYNQNGQRDTSPPDRNIAYRCTLVTGSPANRYQVLYYPDYVNPNSPSEVMARSVTACNFQLNDNYVDITITACWDPDGTPNVCGAPDNPQVTMRNRIKMPSVSTN